MARHVVASVDEIPPGRRKVVDIEGRSVGIFNVNGEYFALRNRCPHQGGELCKGRQVGVLQSPLPGEFELTRPGEIVRCPWHGWEFDIRTGQSWFDPRGVRVRRYDVSVEPGSALVPERPTSDLAAADAAGTPPAPPEDVPPCAMAGVVPPSAPPGTTPADLAGGADAATDADMGGLAKGPYVAETYPVSIDHAYVVVEIGRPASPHATPADQDSSRPGRAADSIL